MNVPTQTADVIAPPPIIYGTAFLLSLVLQIISPIALLSQPIQLILGVIFIGLGVVFAFTAIQAFQKAKTNVRPDKPTTALVTTGPYRYTRNPIYWALSLVYLGAAFLTNSWIAVLLLPVVLVIINRGVIDREERYLHQLFGEAYADYTRRVRRWL